MDSETLEMASMALNAKVAQFEKYPEGCGGWALLTRYKRALSKVNEALLANDTPTRD